MFDELPEGLRVARPDDYDAVAPVLDAWWGRPILDVLPRLFLDHFHSTSLVAPRPGRGPAAPRGLLVGLLSPAEPEEAYVHLVGIAPDERGTGLGRLLYETFLDGARRSGRRRVCAVTSPANDGSVRFHRAMGFTATPAPDHNGPSRPMVTFRLEL